MEVQPKFLTAKQVAAALNCSRQAVYRLVELGQLIAPLRVAGSPRWEAMDIEVYAHRLRRGDIKGLPEDENGQQDDDDEPSERPKKGKI